MPEGHQFTQEEIYRLFGLTDEEREAFLGSPSNEAYLRARQEAKNQLSALQAQVTEHFEKMADGMNERLNAEGIPGHISVEICPALHADEKG